MSNVTVAFTEAPGSPIEDMNHETFRVTRNLRCAWADRFLLREQLLGLSSDAAQLPDEYVGQENCYVSSVATRPEGELIRSQPVGGVNVYDTALVTVIYETPKQGTAKSVTEDSLIEESIEPSNQVVVRPHKGLYWSDSQWLIASEAPAIMVSFWEWTVTYHNVKTIRPETFTFMDHVNVAAVVSRTLGYTFPAETLLYRGGRTSRTISINKRVGWTLVQPFSINPIGWNMFYRGNSTTPQRIYNAIGGGSGDIMYFFPRSDFTLLQGT